MHTAVVPPRSNFHASEEREAAWAPPVTPKGDRKVAGPDRPELQDAGPRDCTPVARDTLRMLSLVLKTAFRLHCTGEAVGGKGPWELIQVVRQKLAELSQQPETLVSEDLLLQFLGLLLQDGPPEPSGRRVNRRA